MPSSPGVTAHQSTRHAQQVVGPASSGVYLGAQVNPAGIPNPTASDVVFATSTLESQIGRKLALHLHYAGTWSNMSRIASDPSVLDDVKNGRVPIFSWNCSDNETDEPGTATSLNLVDIASGLADNDLRAIAAQFSAIRFPDGKTYPVMVRYFWEMNINATSPGLAGVNGNGGCFVGTDSSKYPGQFIAAWQHIAGILHSGTPAPNISLVFNPGISPDQIIPNVIPSSPFYPGPTYVDWIGLDGYSKVMLPNPPGNPADFDQIFATDYVTYTQSQYGNKPIMIGETAACQQYLSPYDQATFILNLRNAIETGTPSQTYPQVKAVNYFDAPGQYSYLNSQHVTVNCVWSLTTAAGGGVSALTSLAQDPFFSPHVVEAP